MNVVKSYHIVVDGKIERSFDIGFPEGTKTEAYTKEAEAVMERKGLRGEVKEGKRQQGLFVDEYIKDGKLKTDWERFKLGRLDPGPGYTCGKDGIRKKTIEEKLESNEIKLEPEQEIIDGEIKIKSWEKLIEEKLKTFEDWLNAVVRPERDQRIHEADLVWCNAERWHFYSESEKIAWRDYKQALRDVPNKMKAYKKDIVWPKKPG